MEEKEKKHLNIEENMKISYCIPVELRDEQIKINIGKVKERLSPSTELIKEPIALVSFGPSLNDTWRELKKFNHIITCSGAHKFLLDKGLSPNNFKHWYHADLDPREYKIKILGEPRHGIEYLIASTIHPKYLDALKGYDVKLWHIFATDDEAERVLPRGEWKFTGGSSVGLRTFTLARALGYTDFHVFGMDGSMRPNETHTTEHPNPPPQSAETEYKGKKYITTPSMLHVAKETFKEMDQLPDCKFKFYGEGLVQDMAKDYVPNVKRGSSLAFVSEETISKEYIELNRKLHEDNPSYGMGGSKYVNTVLELSKANKTTSILDYGCGKGMLAKGLPFPIWEYDPAVLGKTTVPKPADIVVCTDVLEHIEQDKLMIVLQDLKRCVKQVGYFVISTRKAVKTYANGENAHLIVQGKDWWEKKLKKYFEVGTVIEKEKECELHVIVGPKKEVQPEITTIEKGGLKFKFYTPNDTTRWRANTLFIKEPTTIDWLDSIKHGEVLYDVGANVGSYTVYAGVRGVKVYAFEPEAENYAMLVRNMRLNGLDPTAYCVACSDKQRTVSLSDYKFEFGMLNLSMPGAGGSCHSFNEKESNIKQGCFSTCIDNIAGKLFCLPKPDHIKIDVDGIEHCVVFGAANTLKDVKSIIVEIDPNSENHKKMILELERLGFYYDQAQVDRATRKEGNFKGYAEYVFRKNVLKTSAHVYPFFVLDNVFTENYDKIVEVSRNLKYQSLEEARGTKGYPERYVAGVDEKSFLLIKNGINQLKKEICEEFNLNAEDYDTDLLFINDKPGYKIGVHRDRLDKVVTALIYLPENTNNSHAGTSIYKPKKEGFSCPVGKHYGFDDFDKVETIGYVPNRAFVFLNTDHSFHGVEPCDVERHVLLMNLNKKK
jgi:FkbM family methyltransferase